MAATLAIARPVLVMVMLSLAAFGASAPMGAGPGTPSASPEATPAISLRIPLLDVDGKQIGDAQVSESRDLAVTFTVTVSGLTPGPHGIHVHESGRCDAAGATPFASAGAHFNPTDGTHGSMDDPEGHAGDLGNIVVGDDGAGHLERTTSKVTLSPGPVTLADADGSALVIHADRDDLATDPDGKSGARIACGVIFAPAGTPAATPAS